MRPLVTSHQVQAVCYDDCCVVVMRVPYPPPPATVRRSQYPDTAHVINTSNTADKGLILIHQDFKQVNYKNVLNKKSIPMPASLSLTL